MKKIITFICISFFCILSLSAQEKKGGREKIRALKISYLTEQLNLTSTEAEKFWPIYNAHNDKTNKTIREKLSNIKKEIKKAGSIEALDDKKALELFDLLNFLEKKKFEETQKFYAVLTKVISVKKILKLQIAEREFGKKLMKKYRHKKEN